MSKRRTTTIDCMLSHADDGMFLLLEEGGGVYSIDGYFIPEPKDGVRARVRVTVEILDDEDAVADRAAEWDRVYGHAK